MQCLFNKRKKPPKALLIFTPFQSLEYMEKMKGSSKIMLALTLSFGRMIMDNLFKLNRAPFAEVEVMEAFDKM